MQKFFYIFFSIILASILAGCVGQSTKSPEPANKQDENQAPSENNNQTNTIGEQNSNIQVPGTTPKPEVGTPLAITLAEVAKHSSREDCWLVAKNKVYNVTSFIDKHPGGDKILSGCGQDMTEFFNTKHVKQFAEYLPQFYIGDLKQ